MFLRLYRENIKFYRIELNSGSMEGEASVYTDPLHRRNFFNKLYEMYLSQTLCDVKLCVEEKELSTHKTVLAANSPYFEGMFTANFMESSQENIVLKEISYDVLKCLVDFCYTSRVDIHGVNSLELLSAANMFQFEGIKEYCSVFLESKIDAENCLKFASFADLHSSNSLKEKAEEYMRKNFLAVINSKDFLLISVHQLTDLISNDGILVNSEKDIFEAVIKWIDYDLLERKNYFEELFMHLRLPNLPPKVLVNMIEKHPYAQENLKCIKFVSEAKTYHLLPSCREELSVNASPRSIKSDLEIYLIGGETRSQVFDSVECYSFADNCWKAKKKLCSPRDGLGVTTYDGKIFVAGGYDGNNALSTCECYHPERNTWTHIRSMNNPRHAFSMAELQGWLYVAGGSNFSSTEYNTVERYDPDRNEWLVMPSMSMMREGLALISDGNVIYAIGGENGFSILNTVEKYDPREGVWYNCAPMSYRRRYFGASMLKDKIYCVGGSDYEEDLNAVEMFDVRANRWILAPSMCRRRESVAVASVNDKLFAIGGACNNRETDSVEYFDPQLNKWQPFRAIPRSKEGMGAVVL